MTWSAFVGWSAMVIPVAYWIALPVVSVAMWFGWRPALAAEGAFEFFQGWFATGMFGHILLTVAAASADAPLWIKLNAGGFVLSLVAYYGVSFSRGIWQAQTEFDRAKSRGTNSPR